MKKLTPIILILLILIFSGCSNKTLPPLKTYNLTANEKCCEKSLDQKDLTLQILEPTTNKYLNSTSLYYSDDQYLLQTYKLSKWSDYPTKMLLEVILSKVDQLNMFKNITTNTIYAKPDYVLQSELFDFKQTVIDQESNVNFKIKFYLIDEQDYANAVSKTFTYKVNSESVNAYGAIKALNKATNLMLKDLSIWLANNTKEVK
jgi:cholesterol transport system auxiliary component